MSLRSWSGHQAHVAVRGDALSMENHLHSGVFLVHENGVVDAVVQHYVEALGFQVAGVGYLHCKIRTE